MEELFNNAVNELNDNLKNINKILINICSENEAAKNLIAAYYNKILDLKYEPYELVFPYMGMKEEVIFTTKTVNYLLELYENFLKIKYENDEFFTSLNELLMAERQLYTIYAMIYFEPFSWNIWQDFASKKLKNRCELLNTLLLAISILQSEYPEEVLDKFYEFPEIPLEKRFEILDFMAYNHVDQRYINGYFQNKIIENVSDIITRGKF